jgi:hypothetical protein
LIELTPRARQAMRARLTRPRGGDSAPSFVRLQMDAASGLLVARPDHLRVHDELLELGEGEVLLVDRALVRVIDGFVVDTEETDPGPVADVVLRLRTPLRKVYSRALDMPRPGRGVPRAVPRPAFPQSPTARPEPPRARTARGT